MSESWTLTGAEGLPLRGLTDRPAGSPRGVVLIAHGFKGYKEYGFLPHLARVCADAGLVAHRFDFSHSGMGEDPATFQHPDRFERDTWNLQVHDLLVVADAIRSGRLAGGDADLTLFGHSRGGATCLLAAARHAERLRPARLVTAAAPAVLDRLSDAERRLLHEKSRLPSPSARTGQVLHVGRAWLEEQERDPAAHDLLALVARLAVPVLLIHGSADPTVPAEDALRLASAIGPRAVVRLIPDANHVFGVPNPFDPLAPPPPALAVLEALVTAG